MEPTTTPSATSHRLRWLGLLAALGVGMRLGWAAWSPTPWDDDALYYQLVADNIVAGRGAVTDAVFILAAPPAALPAAADVYWMPLPSRVIVPLTALLGELGGPLTAALLGAVAAPLAWLLARDSLSAPARVAGLAGLLAASGGYLLRPLSTADCHALTAALGALGFWAVSRQRLGPAVLAAAGLALTRSDGFLLAAALGLALPLRRGALVAGAGLAATGLWTLRIAAVAGTPAVAAKGLAGRATRYSDLFTGQVADVRLPERLARAGEAMATALPDYWGLSTLGLFAPLLLWGAWRHRQQPWVRAWAAAFLGLPVLSCVLAPIVVEHGTLHRTGAALLAPSAVLLAAGIDALVSWLHDRRGYPRLPALGFVAIVYLGCSVWLGLLLRAAEGSPPDCAALPGEGPVFTTDPLRVAYHCRRPAVAYSAEVPAETLAQLQARYGVCWAMTARPPDNLPGWAPGEAGVWHHPDARCTSEEP